MPDYELQEKLLSVEAGEIEPCRLLKLMEKFPQFSKELKKAGVTLKILWQEYKEKETAGYNYSQFCHYYHIWSKSSSDTATMHMEHKAGDKMFVDYTGKKMKITDKITGEIKEVEIFVAILGACGLTYVEASESQKKAEWIASNERAVYYMDGVPQAIVPDCLKSGVSNGNKYEPDINPEYLDFANHYGTVIIPARPSSPRDKSLVENAVNLVYMRIFAPLRDKIFYSISEINEAIWEKLEDHNNCPMQKLKTSRRELFNEIEKAALQRLPGEKYELKKILSQTIQCNYHIELREDNHYYSVSYKHIGKKVDIRYSETNVEIFYNNNRIALHKRDKTPGKYTTLTEHMHPDHKFCRE